MNSFSKFLIGSGVILIALGLLWQFGGKLLPLGRLPGDIAIERQNFRFYFPLASSLLLSLLLSGVLYLLRYFR